MSPNEKIYSFVSVIVPVFNASRTIEKCVHALIDQDYPRERYEIIIVDNNSTDDSIKLIKKYPVVLYFEKDIQTSYAARNRGILESKGDIICFTDSDCIAHKHWISDLVSAFEDPQVGAVGGLILSYEPTTQVEKYIDKNMLVRHSKKTHFMPFAATANAAYRRDVFEKVGLFNEKNITGSDMEMSWRMQLKTGYKMAFTDNAVIYHKHRTNLRQFFLQRRRNGIASIILCSLYGHYQGYPKEKYSNSFVKSRFRDEMKSFLKNILKILKILITKIKGRDPDISILIFHTDRIGFLLGQIEGIIKYRLLKNSLKAL